MAVKRYELSEAQWAKVEQLPVHETGSCSPKLLLNDDHAGKPEGIHLMIGRRPHAAFGNSVGDREMLEWTGAGDGARLDMLALHDDFRA